MDYIIAGGVVFCCVAVPLMVGFFLRRKRRPMSVDKHYLRKPP